MNEIAHEFEPADSVKSVTLAELRSQRPSMFGRIAGFARGFLMLWGALSLGAAAGTAVFYLDGSDGLLLIGQGEPDDQDKELQRVALFSDIVLPSSEIPTLVPRGTAPLEIPEPIVEDARLPRPRPDEPIYTGSIVPDYDPYAGLPQQRRHLLDPCAALNELGAPFPFRLRCSYQTRAYAPPPPRPYQAPHVIR